MNERDDALRASLTVPVALVTMAAWLVSLCYAVLENSFVPLTVTTPVMLLLAGYAFGSTIIKTAKVGGSDE